MSNVLLILLIAVAAGASVYLVWLQRQAGLGPDTSDLTSRIKQLEDALREAELEGARLQERLNQMESQKEQMSQEFKLMAHEALQAQTDALQKQMKEANSAQLSVILAPFREKLDMFGQRVQETHEKGQR